VSGLFENIRHRWSGAWREALASALAAGLSWFLAQRIFGHQQPVFAAISAIICLAPGLASHSKQAVGLLLGVATGIVIGELSLTLPDGFPVLKVILAAFFAMIVAASYGQAVVTPIQAGVSAILIIAFGPATTGSVRMIDVAVGVAVGFIFSQALILEQRYRAWSLDARTMGGTKRHRKLTTAASNLPSNLAGRGTEGNMQYARADGRERGGHLIEAPAVH
jgi:uncharacterized membrane protein YgaE (UPF0421/DUF939 family)